MSCMSKLESARRTRGFTESVIREMTRLSIEHDGVNLSQGFPDFPAPDAVKDAACAAVRGDINQYAITWGAPPMREAIARKFTRCYGVPVNPDTQVTVCCGATEGMIATLLAVVDPGDEVIVFEPFYENYGPDISLSGATPRYVTLREPDWAFDPAELASAFNNRTKVIIINTPNNPTGKVFTRDELTTIARLCQQWGVLAVTDEIYEHIVYDDAEHVPMAAIDGMVSQTVTINSLSKTYSVTGWRVGWTIGPELFTGAIRKVHDFLTVGAAAPLQAAGAVALALPDTFYTSWRRRTGTRVARHVLYRAGDDVAFVRQLITEVGVAAVPGTSFYHDPALGRTKVRFCFCKRDATLDEAERRLAKLQPANAAAGLGSR